MRWTARRKCVSNAYSRATLSRRALLLAEVRVIHSMFSTIQKCLGLLDPAMRRQWVGLLPLTIVTAVLETGGAVTVFLLVKIVNAPAQASALPFVPTLAAWLPWHGEQAIVVTVSVFIVLFYLLKNGVVLLHTYLQSMVASRSTSVLSKRLFADYLYRPYAFHLRRNSAELIRNVTSSTRTTFYVFMTSVLSLITELFVIVGIVAVLLATAPLVTFLVLGVFGGLGLLLLRFTQRQFAAWGESEHELQKTTLQTAQQSLAGIKEIKLSGHESFFHASFSSLQDQLATISQRRSTLLGVPRLSVETVFICGILLLVVLLTQHHALRGEVIPLLGLYAYAGFRIIPSLNRILMHASIIQGAQPVVSQLYAESKPPQPQARPSVNSALPAPLAFNDRLTLEDVAYVYEGSTEPAIQNICLSIQYGETVGIVGASGAGKSTFVDLLLGLISPTHGRITVDSQDLQDVLPAWQRQIGYVPQDIYLLDDSLRRNIAFGLPDEEIDDGSLEAAVHRAQLDKFVALLPGKLDTFVGERGIRLSGGERQRVGIARALYHRPELLVLDEATSALDNQTEREVMRAIEAIRGEKTLIIIAHRMSTIRVCDRLVYLRDGRIDGNGTFDKLVQDNAAFRRMISRPEA